MNAQKSRIARKIFKSVRLQSLSETPVPRLKLTDARLLVPGMKWKITLEDVDTGKEVLAVLTVEVFL